MFYQTTHRNAYTHREQTRWGEIDIIHGHPHIYPQFYSYSYVKIAVEGLDKMDLKLVMKTAIASFFRKMCLDHTHVQKQYITQCRNFRKTDLLQL